jgi:hypothetical protein
MRKNSQVNKEDRLRQSDLLENRYLVDTAKVQLPEKLRKIRAAQLCMSAILEGCSNRCRRSLATTKNQSTSIQQDMVSSLESHL